MFDLTSGKLVIATRTRKIARAAGNLSRVAVYGNPVTRSLRYVKKAFRALTGGPVPRSKRTRTTLRSSPFRLKKKKNSSGGDARFHPGAVASLSFLRVSIGP